MSDQRMEQALVRDTLRSEQLRATILAGLFGVLLLLTVAADLTGVGALERITGKRAGSEVATLAVSLVFGFEVLLIGYFTLLRRRGEAPSRAFLYVSSAIETAAFAGPLFVVAPMVGARDALGTPPSYFFLLLIVLTPLRLDPRLCIFTGLAAGATYVTTALTLLPQIQAEAAGTIFAHGYVHVAKGGIMVVGGVLAAFVTRQILYRHASERRLTEERQRVVDLFGQHVSPEVVDKLLAQDAELPSETREVCMMFLDIRGFTTFSESRTPDEVVVYLNRLFEPLVDVAAHHGGVINKFLGDGFMAVFGAPIADGGAAANAIRAAREMIERVDSLVAAGAIPDTRIGIGLHTGTATTGNVGSRRRKEYTIIGDTVNLASRIESLCKSFDAQILVSDATWDRAKPLLGEAVEPDRMEPVQVKGRDEPVVVYRLM